MASKLTGVKIMTPKFRLNWPYLLKPYTNPRQPDKEPQYRCTMLFAKDEDLSGLKKAVKAAATEAWGPDKTKWPKIKSTPFKDQGSATFQRDDGQHVLREGYEKGAIMIEAKSKQPPGVIDQQKNHILDESEIYSGCYCRAIVVIKAYNFQGNCGITCYLQHIQKMADGDSLSGRTKPEDEFSAISDDSNSELSVNDDLEIGDTPSNDDILGL